MITTLFYFYYYFTVLELESQKSLISRIQINVLLIGQIRIFFKDYLSYNIDYRPISVTMTYNHKFTESDTSS